jgi:hypothetical protein
MKKLTIYQTDLETIENKIIECLNEADDKLNVVDFSRLAESITDYIDLSILQRND